LFPNPASNKFEVQMPSFIGLEKIEALNALGQKLFESDQNNIDIQHLSAGVYHIGIYTTHGYVVKKIIKN
jgi:hypothetical protein